MHDQTERIQMKFSEHRDSNINVVKSYQQGEVKINADVYGKSRSLLSMKLLLTGL
ncbi:hypothetical protein THIOSC15_3350013 [uncultured Thiomicrorhabdus sp.]